MKAIIVHGGAGHDAPAFGFEDGIKKSLKAGYKILNQGGSSTDAVEAAIKVMEDDPQFDAGYGSFLNLFGEVEMDASIMKGDDYSCGAVASVQNIQHPIMLARKIMEETEHVFIAGKGANLIAEALGFSYFDPISPQSKKIWKEYKEKFLNGYEKLVYGRLKDFYTGRLESLGTVGAVAIDEKGHITAGTSTGGTHLKLPGRVGDTPVIGAGTYANPWAGASSTGRGESIIKFTLARRVVDLIEKYKSQEAINRARELANKMNCLCGLISLDKNGNFGMFHTTDYIRVGYLKEGGEIFTSNNLNKAM